MTIHFMGSKKVNLTDCLDCTWVCRLIKIDCLKVECDFPALIIWSTLFCCTPCSDGVVSSHLSVEHELYMTPHWQPGCQGNDRARAATTERQTRVSDSGELREVLLVSKFIVWGGLFNLSYPVSLESSPHYNNVRLFQPGWKGLPPCRNVGVGQ